MLQAKAETLGFGGTKPQYLENSLWKMLWTCADTGYALDE